MIQVYNPSNTDFTKNGNTILQPISALVTAGINRTWQLEVVHPIDEEGRWKSLVTNAVIKAPSFNGDQLWRITKTDKKDSGIVASADPIFYDAALSTYIKDVNIVNKTAQQALTTLCSGTGFSATSNITDRAGTRLEGKNLVEAILGAGNSVIANWGGEAYFNNKTLILNDKCGGDYGVQVLYGKNIAVDGVTEEVDMDEVVTRIIPRAYGGITLTGSTPWVDSPLINNYPLPRIKVYDYEHIRLKDGTESVEEGIVWCNTEAEVRTALVAAAQKEFSENQVDTPTVNLSINMVILANTEEYKEFVDLEKVSVGDYVTCRHAKLGINSKARCISIVWDCIKKATVQVEIGRELRRYFQDVTTVIKATKVAITETGNVKAEQIQGLINGAIAQLTLQNTVAKKQDVRAILFEDLDPDSPTFGALAIGTQGLQISKERTPDGRAWVWTTAATSEGIIASTLIAQDQLVVAKNFFADSNGVHITQNDHDYTTGNNVFIDGDSVDIRKGTTTVATFGTTTRIGETTGSNLTMDTNGIRFMTNRGVFLLSSGDKTACDGTTTQGVSLVLGNGTASGVNAAAFGAGATASGGYSFAIGAGRASGCRSFAQGQGAKATADTSTAMGQGTTASGYLSLATGQATTASGSASFSSGNGTTASGDYSIALGRATSATGIASMAVGQSTTASANYQLVTGRYNATNAEALFIIGAGTGNTSRRNLLEAIANEGINIRGATNSTINLYGSAGGTSTIKAYSADAYGNNLVMQAGGNMILGGGEYAENRRTVSDFPTKGENTFIGADTAVYIEPGANTIADRKSWIFTTGGNLIVPGNAMGYIYTVNSRNRERVVFEPMSDLDNTALGFGNWNENDAGTNIYGREIGFFTRGGTLPVYVGADKTFLKDLAKTAVFYGETVTDAAVGQTTENDVVVKANGTAKGNKGFLVSSSSIGLYNYGNNTTVWSLNPTKVVTYYGSNVTESRVGQTSASDVVVRVNGTDKGDKGLIATPSSLYLYDYTNSATLWSFDPNKLFTYQPGETLEIPAGPYSGYISSSATEVVIFIPLPRGAQGRTITVPKVACYIRGTSGYVDDSYNDTTVGSRAGYVWVTNSYSNGIKITIRKGPSSPYTNVTNNTPISVLFRATLNLTFS